jgi:hypothetical protein
MACLVYTISFFGCEGSKKKEHVDQVELLPPVPFLCCVIDGKYAVWRDPEGWRWVEINSAYGG